MFVCPHRFFPQALPRSQAGMTLIEVLVTVMILAIGLLGAAVIQLNALKFTDSSRMTSQASFIAYDMLDRMRANPHADYTWNRARGTLASVVTANVRDLDLHDFEANILSFAGESAKGTVVIGDTDVTVSISWEDRRGTHPPHARETFTLTSRMEEAQ
jgi:type IV pilus assembly protein PilV